jgi:hypothetical protein
MRKLCVTAAAALALSFGFATAFASGPQAFRGEVKLASAVSAAKEVDVDGVNWKCEGDTCVGEAKNHSTLDSQMKECRKVATALGTLAAYHSRGRDLSAGSVEQCNKAAGKG